MLGQPVSILQSYEKEYLVGSAAMSVVFTGRSPAKCVRATTPEAGWCRIAVRDHGRARVTWVPGSDRLVGSGRGVLIIDGLADAIGSSTTRGGVVSWADLHWNAVQIGPPGG